MDGGSFIIGLIIGLGVGGIIVMALALLSANSDEEDDDHYSY